MSACPDALVPAVRGRPVTLCCSAENGACRWSRPDRISSDDGACADRGCAHPRRWIEEAHVTELTGLLRQGPHGDQLDSWPASMRVFARRERPHPGAQLSLFETQDGWRYSLWVSNVPAQLRGWRAQLGYIDAAHLLGVTPDERGGVSGGERVRDSENPARTATIFHRCFASSLRTKAERGKRGTCGICGTQGTKGWAEVRVWGVVYGARGACGLRGLGTQGPTDPGGVCAVIARDGWGVAGRCGGWGVRVDIAGGVWRVGCGGWVTDGVCGWTGRNAAGVQTREGGGGGTEGRG